MESVKCVAIGDGAVGKTCMLLVYSSGTFPETYVPTIFDNYSQQVMVDDEAVVLDMWDTAGQEDYDRVRSVSYPGTDVFLVCFSLTALESLNNVKAKWAKEVALHGKGAPFVLVGTKLDLRDDAEFVEEHKREGKEVVTTEVGKAMADQMGAAAYFECSAKEQTNLRDVFEGAISAALTARRAKEPKKSGKRGKCIIL